MADGLSKDGWLLEEGRRETVNPKLDGQMDRLRIQLSKERTTPQLKTSIKCFSRFCTNPEL